MPSKFASSLLALSPTGYWRLEDTGSPLLDEVAARNMAVTGSPTYGATGAVNGGANRAITFSGSGQYAVGPTAFPTPSTSISVACWFKTTDTSTPSSRRLFTRTGTGQNSWMLSMTSAHRMRFLIFQADGTTHADAPESSGTRNDGLWHLAVGTFDGTTIRLYIDGGQVASSTTLAGTWHKASTAAPAIAASSAGTFLFPGSVDEVAIFNDRVLTATEISDLYADRLAAIGTVASNVSTSSLIVGQKQASATFATTHTPTLTVLGSKRALGTFTTTAGVTLTVFGYDVIFEAAEPTGIMTLAEVLRATHPRPVARIVFLSDLDTELAAFEYDGEAKLMAGSVTIDRAMDICRTGSVSLVNDDGTFAPGESALVSPARLLRMERGAYVEGTKVFAAIMTGVIIEPSDAVASSQVGFTVNGRLHLLDQQFEGPVTFVAGTRLRSIARTLCELGGLGTNDAWYSLDDGGATLVAARTFDIGDAILPSLVSLAFDHGLEVYDDGYGRIVMTPWADPATLPVAWEFPFEAGTRLLGQSRKYRRRGKVYNRQRVIGVGPDHYPIMAEWRDLNPLSPTYNPVDGSGPLGDRPAPPYVSSDIHTQGQANIVAQRMGTERALLEVVADTEAMPLPGQVWPRNVVTFAGVRHLVDRLTMPLTLGTMSMSSRLVYETAA
jgi:hypothetical protein